MDDAKIAAELLKMAKSLMGAKSKLPTSDAWKKASKAFFQSKQRDTLELMIDDIISEATKTGNRTLAKKASALKGRIGNAFEDIGDLVTEVYSSLYMQEVT